MQPAADLDTLFSQSQTAPQAASRDTIEFARQTFEKVEKLEAILGAHERSELLTPIKMLKGALYQVKEGRIELLHYGLAEQIQNFQKKCEKVASDLASVTCYPDVIAGREKMATIRKNYFPVLDEILVKLIDYRAMQPEL